MPRSQSTNQRKTYWTFTLNNPDGQIEETLKPFVTYACWQLEKGEDGTPHYQGFIQLQRNQRFAYVKKILPRAHWEAVKAIEACRKYCMKEDTREEGPWELGEWKYQGKRSDISEIFTLVTEGSSIIELLQSGIIRNNQHLRFAENIQALEAPRNRIPDREVIVLLGSPGTGKTFDARTQYPDAWIQNNENGTIWFDGYHGQEVAILDDFAGSMSKMGLTMLLRMLHDWEESMPVKGRFVLWKPKKIIITTNIHPGEWYDYGTRSDSKEALFRRITRLIRYYAVGNHITKEEDSEWQEDRTEKTRDEIEL